MSSKETQKTLLIVAIDVILFLITANLGILLNLISTDLGSWYSGNKIFVLIITGVLIILGSTLIIARIWISSKEKDNMAQNDATKFLKVVYDAYREAPDDPLHSKTIQKQLKLSEENAIDLIKTLEEKEFLKAQWIGKQALLNVTQLTIKLFENHQ